MSSIKLKIESNIDEVSEKYQKLLDSVKEINGLEIKINVPQLPSLIQPREIKPEITKLLKGVTFSEAEKILHAALQETRENAKIS